MIKHLLVPLDGTQLAEAALPATKALALTLGARITLLHLIESAPTPAVHGQRHLTGPTEAKDYLEEIRQGMAQDGLVIDCHVHTTAVNDVAGGIVAHREELHPDLIVMCRHGSGGLSRMLHGSLAQQVVALGSPPLLLVRPEEPAFALNNLLVPLDGAPEHEFSLGLAQKLAAAAGGRLHLVSVVSNLTTLAGASATLSRFMPGTTQALQELSASGLHDYLERHLQRLLNDGCAASGEVRRGKVDEEIIRTAAEHDIDLIVLATHGKAGTRAFWANSLTDRLQSKVRQPLLLIPV